MRLAASRTIVSSGNQVARLSLRHITFVLPIILLHVACGLVFVVSASKLALVIFALSSVVQMFGITAGYHRLLAHRSFKTSRQFQFVLALFGVLAGQNGPLWWISHHRYHHRHSDREKDLHSPTHGFFWSHMGWLFSPGCVQARLNLVPDLAAMWELVLLERASWLVNVTCGALLYFAGEAWHAADPDAQINGLQLVFWGAIASKVCVYHAVWSANSICHCLGQRRYTTRDNSRNNVVVALLTFGDGWHNNHHYLPNSARHGFCWWELDINFMVLSLLSRLGIVWDLRLPAPDRLPERTHYYCRREAKAVRE